MGRIWLSSLILAVSLAASGCGDDEGSNPAGEPMDSGTVAESKAKKIGPEGGTIQLTSGAKVEIPQGALSKEIEVRVAEVLDPPPFKVGREKAGRAFSFTPHGTQFEKEVTITVDFEGEEKGLQLTKLDDDKDTSWTQVDGTPSNKLLTGKSKSFSIYCAARATTSASDAGSDAGEDGG